MVLLLLSSKVTKTVVRSYRSPVAFLRMLVILLESYMHFADFLSTSFAYLS